MADFRERLARAMCTRDGWESPDQPAHYQAGLGDTRWVARWEMYIARVDAALAAMADAGLVVLPRDPEADRWRRAAAEVTPDHPLGSFENREMAYQAERVFAALIEQAFPSIFAPEDG